MLTTDGGENGFFAPVITGIKGNGNRGGQQRLLDHSRRQRRGSSRERMEAVVPRSVRAVDRATINARVGLGRRCVQVPDFGHGKAGAAAGTAPFLWAIVFVLVGTSHRPGPDFRPSFPGSSTSQGPTSRPLLRPLSTLRLSPHLARGVVDTVILGVVGAVLATVMGTALALTLDLTDVTGGRFWSVVPWAVFATPGYFKGLAWVLLMLPGRLSGADGPAVARRRAGLLRFARPAPRHGFLVVSPCPTSWFVPVSRVSAVNTWTRPGWPGQGSGEPSSR